MYAGAIEAYEHAIVFARPFRVRGVAIETQAVAFFTTESVEQFVSVFVIIRYRVGHSCRSSLCFAPSLRVLSLRVHIRDERRHWN